jgi:hypothetical protein
MRKKAGTFLLLLFFLILLVVATAPLLLGLERVKGSVVNILERQLNCSIQIGKIHWVWLPLPCLSLSETRVESGTMSISLPETRLYPAWNSLIRRKLEFSKVVLKSPLVHYTAAQSSSDFQLPRVHLVIEDGTLSLPPFADVFTAEELSFSHITGQLKLRPEMVTMDFEFTAPLCKTAFVIGTYRPESRKYDLLLRTTGLNLAQCITRLTTERITLDETGMAMEAKISGTGLDSFKASFAGTLPGVIVGPMDKKKTILLGSSDFAIEKTGNDLSLNISTMEFIQPEFTLKGIIKRSTPDTTGTQPSEPNWLLDLSADDINLSQVRETVLTLWGKSKVAQKVCDIVRGGKASSARYRFNEKVSGFRHIENMNIEVDIESASINIPKTGLYLTRGSGPIAIKEGILTGHDLTASLDESRGSNGSIFLDLKKAGGAFHLDLDIDADLSALPPILDRLVHHEGFRNELHRFSDVSGRAYGHLRLGDSFSDLNTFVTVDRAQVKAFYDRIHPPNDTGNWRIELSQGELQVFPEEISWKNVSARIGSQEIMNMQGSLTWQDDVLLSIDKLDARLDSTSLYEKLQEKKVLPTALADTISFVTGEITIADGSFHGPPADPDQWQYKMSVSSPGLRSSTPLLPAAVFTEAISATISDSKIILPETAVSFMGQPLTLAGNFHHKKLADWQGDIHLKGGINENVSNWLKERWLPANLSPRLPATVKDLTVAWDRNKTEIAGTIHADTPDSLPSLSFALSAEDKYLQLKNVEIKGVEDEGRLTFDLWKTEPEHFLMTWQGQLHHQTLDNLLARNPFLSGTMEGDFNIAGPRFPQLTSFDGYVKLDNVQWPLGEESITTELKKLSLTGKTRQVEVNEISASIGQESFTAKGKIILNDTGPELDIDIVSDSFSQKTVSRLTARFDQAEESRDETVEASYTVTGRIGFSIAAYLLENRPPTPAHPAGEKIGPVTSLTGRVKLFPENRNAIFLSNADFCGLSITGSWYSEASMAEDTLSVTSPAPLLFEEFLPCLNISQDIIKGSFTVDAVLKGNKKWSKGSLNLDSDKGRILRMTLLSRLFRIINITDLFTARELQDYETKGFPYSKLELNGRLDGDNFIIQRLVVLGEGLNIFGSGSVNLANLNTDITLLIAPLKTVDAIIANVPVIGPAVTGKDKAIATIPVGIRGNLLDPVITILPPEAIGDAVLNIVRETLMLPFTILKPILRDSNPQ